MKKVLNNKILLFCIILVIGLIVSIYMLPPSYNTDGYCELNYVISKGFNENKRKIYEEESWPLSCAINIRENKYKVTLIEEVNTKDEKGYFLEKITSILILISGFFTTSKESFLLS